MYWKWSTDQRTYGWDPPNAEIKNWYFCKIVVFSSSDNLLPELLYVAKEAVI